MIAGTTLQMTADEVADRLLNEMIESKYPQVVAAEQRISVIEKELAEELQKAET